MSDENAGQCGVIASPRAPARRHRHPQESDSWQLRLDPDVPADAEPSGVVEGAAGNGSRPRSKLCAVIDRAAALGTEVHLQPAPAGVGPILAFHQFALRLQVQNSLRGRPDLPAHQQPVQAVAAGSGAAGAACKATLHLGTAWSQEGNKAKRQPLGWRLPGRWAADLLTILWLRGQDLNLRPLGYEPNELPDCSTPRLSLRV